MARYWHNRYVEAMAKVEQAQSARSRGAFLDLARHYDAMRHLAERARCAPLLRPAA